MPDLHSTNTLAKFLLIAGFVNTVFFIRTLCILVRTPRLRRIEGDKPSQGHHDTISVLVPARNEASRVLRENLLSLARQTYSALEIIVIDDRSTDSTLSIIEDVRSIFPDRIRVIQGQPLEAGWIGKTFALQQAKEEASGKWLLLADADVIFDSTAVESGIEFARQNQLDALSLLPKLVMNSYWENSILPVICWLSGMRGSPLQANRPSSRECRGSGNFILVRRTAHDAIGGFGRYRSDVLDDCIVMKLLKRAGFKVMVCYGTDLLRSRMYSNLAEIVDGFTKNSFAVLNNSVIFLTVVVAWQVATVFFPFYALAMNICGFESGSGTYAAIAILPMLLTMSIWGADVGASLSFFVLYPIGCLASMFIIVRSAFRYFSKRHVEWKGRVVNQEIT
jgi:chlorobactene glucosyltransferase